MPNRVFGTVHRPSSGSRHPDRGGSGRPVVQFQRKAPCPVAAAAGQLRQGDKAGPIIAKISQKTLAEMIGTNRARVKFFMNSSAIRASSSTWPHRGPPFVAQRGPARPARDQDLNVPSPFFLGRQIFPIASASAASCRRRRGQLDRLHRAASHHPSAPGVNTHRHPEFTAFPVMPDNLCYRPRVEPCAPPRRASLAL